eukprot:6841-Heterococcus_DN1.PRE.2
MESHSSHPRSAATSDLRLPALYTHVVSTCVPSASLWTRVNNHGLYVNAHALLPFLRRDVLNVHSCKRTLVLSPAQPPTTSCYCCFYYCHHAATQLYFGLRYNVIQYTAA